mmetsp:Transcript_45946/g.115668  ORF Transcript_45946/g.115668 Transcript_45946/m.115668 type:complete len:285 (+) Transcript_45946:180-1034(+)
MEAPWVALFSTAPAPWQAYLALALQLAKEAGEVVRTARLHDDDSASKSSSVDLVTKYDKQCEQLIFDGIRKAYPSHLLIGEESTSEGNKIVISDETTWIVDPIDGTTNFIHSFPYTCISIAVAEGKRPVVGVVHAPLLGETFVAIEGCGAFLNGTRIKVSKTTKIDQAVIVTEAGYHRKSPAIDIVLGNIQNLLQANVRGLRMCGSAALNFANVAAGRIDLYYEWGCFTWDWAAGCLLVTEAGGVVRDPSMAPHDLYGRAALCASSQELAEAVGALIKPPPLSY